jgi:hypothetical protein
MDLMRQNPSDDRLLRSYLLGELPEQEADRLEERLLADDELFDLMEALEAELLADCSRGELAPAERERVLRRLASSPQGRERLALAGSLNKVADGISQQATVVPFRSRATAPKAVFQWVAMAAGLLLVAGLSWFQLQTPQMPQKGNSPPVHTSDSQAPEKPIAPPVPEEKQASKSTPQQPERTPETTTGPVTTTEKIAEQGQASTKRPDLVKAVLALSLTTLRGGEEETQELRLGLDADIAEIQLNNLAGVEEFESFHVAIRNKEKETIWEKDGLTSRQQDEGPALVLDVPAGQLASGLYEVRVQGTPAEGEPEDLAIQEFRIVRAGRI